MATEELYIPPQGLEESWLGIMPPQGVIPTVPVEIPPSPPPKQPFPLAGWMNRKTHVIAGTTAGQQTNYQMKITVHKGAGADSGMHVYLDGKCRDDFGDIRFTKADESTLLDYWIESKVNGDYAIFWVEVDVIPASPSSVTIYIYYNKADETTTSNGEATFPLFDHFNDGSLGAIWTVEQNPTKFVESGTTLRIYADPTQPRARTTSYQSGCSRAMRTRLRFVQTRADATRIGFKDIPDNDFVTCPYVLSDVNQFYSRCSNNGNMAAGVASGVFDVTAFFIVELRRGPTPWTGGRYYHFYLNDVYKGGTQSDTYVPDDTLYMRLWGATTAGRDVILDWFLVMKISNPTPTHGAWGEEETDP